MITEKVALVTGGANGIGKAVAERFLSEGYYVVVMDLPATAEEFAIPIGARFFGGDVTSKEDWTKIVDGIEAIEGRLDVLVNSAGILGGSGSIADYPVDRLKQVLDINVTGSFLGMQAVAPLMTKGSGGSIVNLASISSFRGRPGATGYTASKHAVAGITKVAALDLAASGIRVNAVAPGIIDTRLYRGALERLSAAGGGRNPEEAFLQGIPLKRAGKPSDVAAAISFLSSDDASYITGAILPVDGGSLAY